MDLTKRTLLGEIVQFARLDFHAIVVVHNVVAGLKPTVVEVLRLISIVNSGHWKEEKYGRQNHKYQDNCNA